MLEQCGGPIGPIRFDAAPIHGPIARPNVAAHRTATQPRTAAYWTFAAYGPRSGGRVLLVTLTAYGREQDVGDRTKT